MNESAPIRHGIARVRHELKMRELAVRRLTQLTPRMLRVTLAGEQLQGFNSASPDDHVKVFFPAPGEEHALLPHGPPGAALHGDGPRPIARDYTPRRFDPQRLELDLDFVLHGEGPAASWAASARVGQRLGIGGPRGSSVVADDFDWYWLIGDETALPAIGRRLDELRPQARVHALIEVQDQSDRQPLSSRAQLTEHWLFRGQGSRGTAALLLEALRALTASPGDGYVWIAAESNVARTLREHLLHERGFNKAWVKAAGYWKHGAAATHETHND